MRIQRRRLWGPRDRSKFGNKAVRAYGEKGYQVYPVHPAEKEIEGYRAYRSVLEIPDRAELVSFYIPPSIGLKMKEICGILAIGAHPSQY